MSKYNYHKYYDNYRNVITLIMFISINIILLCCYKMVDNIINEINT